jgi:hypothetical protein
MRFSISFIFIFGFNILVGQLSNPTTITILGRYKRIEKCIGYVLNIDILDETNKCDSNYPMSSNEKYNHLQDFIKTNNYSIVEINQKNGIFEKKSNLKYEIIVSKPSDVYNLINNCKTLGISIEKIKYYFKEKVLSDEDYYAKMAFEDAQKKAEIYCNSLGLKLKSVLIVDDLTSINEGSLHYKKINHYNEYNAELYNFGHSEFIFDFFDFFNLYGKIRYSEKSSIDYTIKVVFEVE